MNFQKNSSEHIEKLINENQIEQAIEILDHVADNKSLWFQNAHAVCLMRLGRPKEAVKILTPTVFHGGSVVADTEVPDKIKLNLVEAMLLAGNVSGAVSLMEDIKGEGQHRKKLVDAFKKWKKSLSCWSRLAICLGALPYDKPVALETPLGEP
jgi:predicted Zn-dependent protease